MKYACNYSKELMKLLKTDQEICDYIKIGDFGNTRQYMQEAYKLKPLLIHGFGWHERGGIADTKIMDFEWMNKRLNSFDTPFLGMHAIAFKQDIEQFSEGETVLKHMEKIFNEIQGKLNCELIIENMDYTDAYDYKTTVKETVVPEFLSELIYNTNLYMLLDISHAFVSAHKLGIDIYEYLDRLPLDKVREIHFSGSHFDKNKGFLDIHGIMGDRDYQVAKYLATHSKVSKSECLQMITLEYGTSKYADEGAIKEQLMNLKNIFKGDLNAIY